MLPSLVQQQRRWLWVPAFAGTTRSEGEQSHITMRLFKMQMTVHSTIIFCLPVQVEMRTTYFRRMISQENSWDRDVANKIKNVAGEGKTWVNFWGQ